MRTWMNGTATGSASAHTLDPTLPVQVLVPSHASWANVPNICVPDLWEGWNPLGGQKRGSLLRSVSTNYWYGM